MLEEHGNKDNHYQNYKLSAGCIGKSFQRYKIQDVFSIVERMHMVCATSKEREDNVSHK